MTTEGARTSQPGFGIKVLNVLLHATHLFVIVFSILGWIWPATWIANFVLLLMVLGSWYGLGPLLRKPSPYGYCVITDLQWRLRQRMGLAALQAGYIKFLIERLTGRDLDAEFVDRVTAAVFFSCLAASIATGFVF